MIVTGGWGRDSTGVYGALVLRGFGIFGVAAPFTPPESDLPDLFLRLVDDGVVVQSKPTALFVMVD